MHHVCIQMHKAEEKQTLPRMQKRTKCWDGLGTVLDARPDRDAKTADAFGSAGHRSLKTPGHRSRPDGVTSDGVVLSPIQWM